MLGLSLGAWAGAKVVATSAPSLSGVEWVSAEDDAEPDFDVDLPGSATAGDDLVAQVSVANADTWSAYFTHTLSAQDIIDDEITISGVDTLANGDYDFRFRLERGVLVGAWFVVEDVTINTAGAAELFVLENFAFGGSPDAIQVAIEGAFIG
jgi:hypothetical protein